MQISTILNYIDNGHIGLSEFPRGYVCLADAGASKAYGTAEIIGEPVAA